MRAPRSGYSAAPSFTASILLAALPQTRGQSTTVTARVIVRLHVGRHVSEAPRRQRGRLWGPAAPRSIAGTHNYGGAVRSLTTGPSTIASGLDSDNVGVLVASIRTPRFNLAVGVPESGGRVRMQSCADILQVQPVDLDPCEVVRQPPLNCIPARLGERGDSCTRRKLFNVHR